MDTIVVTQIVIDSPVAFIRAFRMNLFNLVGQAFIFRGSAAQLPSGPFMVSGTRHMEQVASRFNGISFFFMALFDCCVDLALSYF